MPARARSTKIAILFLTKPLPREIKVRMAAPLTKANSVRVERYIRMGMFRQLESEEPVN